MKQNRTRKLNTEAAPVKGNITTKTNNENNTKQTKRKGHIIMNNSQHIQTQT